MLYEVNGIRFRLRERTEEGLRNLREDIYNRLQKHHKIKDTELFLSYDEVIKLFEPNHPYGRSIEELKSTNYTIELYSDGTYSFNKNSKPLLSRQRLEEQNDELHEIIHDYAKIIEDLKKENEKLKQENREMKNIK